ncbi:1,4-alpha-glucan branching enzyme [Clostridia bacterium]|nr:1,4-alpha-glucan branching enzyme [Clostridia bacterium]
MKTNKLKILDIDPHLSYFEGDLNLRMGQYLHLKQKLTGGGTLSDFANAHLYYGFHKEDGQWVYREWAPNAERLMLVGDFNGWNADSHPLTRVDNGNWEIKLSEHLEHNSKVKVRVTAGGMTRDRVPLYARRVVWDYSHNPAAQIWDVPDFQWTDENFKPAKPLLVYECHIGMSTEEARVSTYNEFTEYILPRVKTAGYNTVQLMAVMEHPYYASFGYQVTNFFAASSRFGTPEELKTLINTAHGMGITVLLDLVHSHAATNVLDGINEFDGTDYQFFHAGPQGNHPNWGTKLFNYAKPEVLHFLLSNLKYWQTEFHFDGFRFDGVTSMLYHHHGVGVDFTSYDKYFSMATDTDAVAYLQLANDLIREVNPRAITIAEDMSGMPGMAYPVKGGGIGFDYRLSMGVPDFWIKTLKTTSDENWDLERLWHELTTRRPGERNIGYAESHDQALVGDKTIIFWLADADMYWNMSIHSQSLTIDRAVALHKIIRLLSLSLAGEGYMNFIGNEFGHPEWIDFPRAGNHDSYQYARRQWSLADNPDLKYQYLQSFDRAIIKVARTGKLLGRDNWRYQIHQDGKLLVYRKGDFYFAVNLHHEIVHHIHIPAEHELKLVLDSDAPEYGGFGRNGKIAGNNYDIHPRTIVVFK